MRSSRAPWKLLIITCIILSICSRPSIASADPPFLPLDDDAIELELGDVAPFGGILMPPRIAANLVAQIEAGSQIISLERAHGEQLVSLCSASIEALDSSAAEQLSTCSSPPWWSSGWTWAAVGAGVASGLVAGDIIGGSL